MLAAGRAWERELAAPSQGWVGPSPLALPWGGPGRTVCVLCPLCSPLRSAPRGEASGLLAGAQWSGSGPERGGLGRSLRAGFLEEASVSHLQGGWGSAGLSESKKPPPSPTTWADPRHRVLSSFLPLLFHGSPPHREGKGQCSRGDLRVCSSSSFIQQIVTEHLICAGHFFSPGTGQRSCPWVAHVLEGGPVMLKRHPPSVSPSLKWEWLVSCLQVLGAHEGQERRWRKEPPGDYKLITSSGSTLSSHGALGPHTTATYSFSPFYR